MTVIRKATSTDAAAIAELYAPYVTDTAITFDENVPTADDFAQRIVAIQPHYPFLVAEVNGKVLGFAYAHAYYGKDAYKRTAELTIYVHQNAGQSGLGQALYKEIESQLQASARNCPALVLYHCPQ